MPTLLDGMNPPTPTSRSSSTESGRLVQLRPRRSRLLLAWWLGVHGLAALCLALAALGLAWKCLSFLALASHGLWRFPAPVPSLARSDAGSWSVAGLGRAGLRLTPESRDGGWWIRLALEDARGSLRWVILKDQLDPDTWHALQAVVRRGRRIK